VCTNLHRQRRRFIVSVARKWDLWRFVFHHERRDRLRRRGTGPEYRDIRGLIIEWDPSIEYPCLLGLHALVRRQHWIIGWELDFLLGTSPQDDTYGEFSTVGYAGGTFSGTGSITTSGSPSTLYETVILGVATFGGPGDVFVTAPFNFGSAPEPASFGMLAAGLGILAWLGRRRKAA
jgi:hypothetical protein